MRQPMLHDPGSGLFPTVDEVYGGFMRSAADAGVEPSVVPQAFAAALAGDPDWRELVEEICCVEFL